MASHEPTDQPQALPEPTAPVKTVAHLELKAAALLAFTVLLMASSVLFLLYARGAFEPTQRLVLTTDDSEGVVVGMDMTFSGFPIGRVRRVELGETGNVRILIDVDRKDAHWLRTTSVFTLVRGVVGGTAIRAFSGVLTDPPLPDGAERAVLRGDATAEIPHVISAVRELLANLNAITAQDAALRGTLANLQETTDKLKGPRGALGVLLGNEADARKVIALLERTNTLLERTDTQVFGPGGVMPQTRETVAQLNALLGETRTSLRKVDAMLVDAQAITANTKVASEDLGALRAEVEANLRKVESLVNEINRKWPFARDTEVRLP